LQNQYGDKNVQFIGIAVDDKQAVLNYQAKTKINYPVLIAGDDGLKIAKAWGNTADSVPFTIVVNPQGRIIFKQVGEVDKDKLLEAIQPMLNLELVRVNSKQKFKKPAAFGA
jgi:peroxiredoxin